MDPVHGGLGRCSCCFWLAVVFDIVGLLVLLFGVFSDVFFYDLLIYAGAMIIFMSLIWWVFWYSGNIEVPPAELEDDVGLLKKDRGILRGVGGVVSRLSNRFTTGIRNSFRRNGTSSSRSQRSQGVKSGPPQTGQVTVSMTTIPPHGPVSTDAEMPQTST